MSLVAYDNSSDESEEDNKPMKKTRETVKITIPSLKEFEDEEDEKPVAKKPKFQSGSGLFSLLPPPKNSLSAGKSGFVPHILSKKDKTSKSADESKKKAIPVSAPLKSTPPTTEVSASEEHESDDENLFAKDSSNAANKCDFFWLDDLASKNETTVGSTTSAPLKSDTFLQDLSSQLPCSSTSIIDQTCQNEKSEDVYLQHQKAPGINTSEAEGNSNYISSEQSWLTVDDSYDSNSSNGSKETLLNEKEFLKLQGRKRESGNIDIIDVNADDQLTDRNEWLMKSVTEESTYRPKKKHGLPTQQQKRKHQITYLAFQAKEREMDLKNQWSLNRLTRRETQSKYGF